MTAATEDFLRIIEVIGVWLAAIATFYAARTALRIAGNASRRRVSASLSASIPLDDRLSLSVGSLSKRSLRGERVDSFVARADGFTAEVVNQSQIEVAITEIALTNFALRGSRVAFDPRAIRPPTSFPLLIAQGRVESVTHDRIELVSRYLPNGILVFPAVLQRLLISRTKLLVSLATGETHMERVSPPCRAMLVQDWRETVKGQKEGVNP